jgi:ABC-type oligopeptide transport system ATPase subunit
MSEIIQPAPAKSRDVLLHVSNLKKYFPIRGGVLNRVVNNVKAVNDVSFDVLRGEVVGLVGESGSGKTTVGRTVLRLEEPTSGSIDFDGADISRLSKPVMRRYRKRMQIVFQDPYASLNPREKIRTMLGHALAVHNIGTDADREDRIVALLEQVGLTGDYLDRFPHEFSGGQRQRIGIARALAVEPDFIVADEPVSALDVSIQAQVVNLLDDLKAKFNLTMLFIAHDLAVVEHISDRVIVMYLDIHARKERIILTGDIPSPINPPSGCVFRTRCPMAIPDCAKVVPELKQVSPGQFSACIRTAP